MRIRRIAFKIHLVEEKRRTARPQHMKNAVAWWRINTTLEEKKGPHRSGESLAEQSRKTPQMYDRVKGNRNLVG